MVLGGDSDLDWPTLDELKVLLDVTSTDAHDGQLQAFLDAAIAQTKTKRGNWDEMTDMPDAALAASALDAGLRAGINRCHHPRCPQVRATAL